MSDLVLLPEMLTAGLEEYQESVERDLKDHEIVIAVYLAMRAIEEIAHMKTAYGVH